MLFKEVNSIGAALDSLAEHGAAASLLAGGTDLMVQLANGEVDTKVVISLAGLSEQLGAVVSESGRLKIGALATLADIADSPEVRTRFPALAYAASTVGGWQTQSMGTLGGNICNASPAADTCPALLVHDAMLELQSKDQGTRTLSLSEFLLGRRETARAPDELLAAVSLEFPPERSADFYFKVGRRSAMEVAIAGLAIRCDLAEDLATISEVRIATCALGPAPRRAKSAEDAVRGRSLSDDVLADAIAAIADDVFPIDDFRATAHYRMQVLRRMLAKGLRTCIAEARGKQKPDRKAGA